MSHKPAVHFEVTINHQRMTPKQPAPRPPLEVPHAAPETAESDALHDSAKSETADLETWSRLSRHNANEEIPWHACSGTQSSKGVGPAADGLSSLEDKSVLQSPVPENEGGYAESTLPLQPATSQITNPEPAAQRMTQSRLPPARIPPQSKFRIRRERDLESDPRRPPPDFGPPTLCFPSRRACIWSSWIIAVLVILGISLFFVWPRIPSVEVSKTYVPDGKLGVIVSGALATATTEMPFVVQLNLAVKVTVENPNYLTLWANKISFSGYLLGIDDATRVNNTILYGGVRNVEFQGRGATQFVLPIQLLYATSNPFSLSQGDEALLLFNERCENLPQAIQVEYQVTVDLALVSWTGYRPGFSDRASFMCPQFDLGAIGGPRGPRLKTTIE
ncbi:hypothetical protein HDU81_007772 [Chytriomyces hyalinus]|nr:hypothetical protein HDU81_007772 [Chytriomyces hyalinus]